MTPSSLRIDLFHVCFLGQDPVLLVPGFTSTVSSLIGSVQVQKLCPSCWKLCACWTMLQWKFLGNVTSKMQEMSNFKHTNFCGAGWYKMGQNFIEISGNSATPRKSHISWMFLFVQCLLLLDFMDPTHIAITLPLADFLL